MKLKIKRALIFLPSSMCAEPAGERKKKHIQERERRWSGLGEAFGSSPPHLLLLLL